VLRGIKNILLLGAAVLTVFVSGSVMACSGNYCSNTATPDCIVVDVVYGASCCLAIGGGGTQCWTCDREAYMCEGGDLEYSYGPPFNCHSPGAACN
jgi:hypothetical protein